jgi:hypothetical protein
MSFTRHRLRAVPATAAVLVLLAACSSGADGTTATDGSSAAGTEAPAAQQGERPGGGGTTGEVAAVSDALLQVQGDEGQTAVTWDDSTTISQTVAATLSDVTVGSCVVAMTSGDGDAAAATSVAITAATDGECTAGFGGGAGGGGMPGGEAPADGEIPDGAPSAMPEMPDGAPTGGTDGEAPAGGGPGGIAAGLVTAVDGSTITVASAEDDTASTITVDQTTTYSSTVAADATAIAVGRCVTAQGEADSSGQVSATVLVLSDATADGCSTGFGGRGGTPPGGSAAAGEGEGSDA